ncbi:hypothetical protein MXB_913 [Myxobolus squamalis]|nr:hypothetical protein MXB_913 [Myxobolus squamalis]
MVVELDKSKVIKKINQGHHAEGAWVFEGVEKNHKRLWDTFIKSSIDIHCELKYFHQFLFVSYLLG